MIYKLKTLGLVVWTLCATISISFSQTYTNVYTTSTCIDGNTGSIDITIIESALEEEWELPYNLTWENMDSGDYGEVEITNSSQFHYVINNLVGGDYEIIITFSDYCDLTILETVEEIDDDFEIVTTSYNNPECFPFDYCNGNISIEINGNDMYDYSFEWFYEGHAFSINEDIAELCPGNYSIVVESSSGCVKIALYTVCCCQSLWFPWELGLDEEDFCNESNNSNIYVGPVITPASSINAQDGAIEISPTGGSGTYLYTWTFEGAFFSNSEDIYNLIPGEYCLNISDGCDEINACYTIGDGSLCDEYTIAVNSDINNDLCDGSGNIDISITGAHDPYHLLWNNGSTEEDLTALTTGTYCITVTDVNGCTSEACFEVEEAEINIAVVQAIVTNNCSDSHPSGSIVPYIYGPPQPYSYLWENGSTFWARQNLNGGIYCVTITDAEQCNYSECFEVEDELIEIELVNISNIPSCGSGNCSGEIDIDVSGNYNFIYSWYKDGELISTEQDVNSLCTGLYTVLVNREGCQAQASYEIVTDSNLEPVIELININPAGPCSNSDPLLCIGAIDVLVHHVDPLSATFEWYQYGNLISSQEDLWLTCAGEYTLVVKDGTCEVTETFTIPCCNYDLDVTIPLETMDPTCTEIGNNTASLTAEIHNALGPVSIEWSNGQSQVNTIYVSESGTYCVSVSDVCGYTVSACRNIECAYDDSGLPTDYCTDVYNQIGIMGYEDCQCIGDCSIFDFDGSDINLLWNWDLIMGTVTVFWPDGEKTYFKNGYGEQQIIGEKEFDIAEEGTYCVAFYADWLNQEFICCFSFFEQHLLCDHYIAPSLDFGSDVDLPGGSFHEYVAIGCFQCVSCDEVNSLNEYLNPPCLEYIPGEEFVQESVVSYIYEPDNPEFPCTGGGKLTILCSCFTDEMGEPITIDIPETAFAYYVEPENISLPGGLICKSLGGCVFAPGVVNNNGQSIQTLPELPSGVSVLGVFCNDTISVNPPDETSAICPPDGNFIVLSTDDCEVTAMCVESGEIITIPGTFSSCTIENDRGDCELWSFCDDFCEPLAYLFDVGCNEGYLVCPCDGSRQTETTSEKTALKSKKENLTITLYPNPVSERLNIRVDQFVPGELDLIVTNTFGERLYKQRVDAIQNNFVFSLNTSEYDDGLYIITISNGVTSVSQKFVVH